MRASARIWAITANASSCSVGVRASSERSVTPDALRRRLHRSQSECRSWIRRIRENGYPQGARNSLPEQLKLFRC